MQALLSTNLFNLAYYLGNKKTIDSQLPTPCKDRWHGDAVRVTKGEHTETISEED